MSFIYIYVYKYVLYKHNMLPLSHHSWAPQLFIHELKGRSFIKLRLPWIIPEILSYDWQCKWESCNATGYTARCSQPMKTLDYTSACNKLYFIWARIHKNLSALTSQVHTQNLRSCFNLRFQSEEFVGVLRYKIYILNDKAVNLSIT